MRIPRAWIGLVAASLASGALARGAALGAETNAEPPSSEPPRAVAAQAPDAGRQAGAPTDASGDTAEAADLIQALAQAGIWVDREAGLCAVEARTVVLDELLEYVLVGPGGALHESLLRTDVPASLLNAGLLLLGAERGTNAVWTPVEPPPTLEERRAGKRPFSVALPAGDGFYLYLAWQAGDERYLFRLEDALTNLRADRSMTRHRWVYLGSRFVEPKPGAEPVFAADREGNMISLVLFEQGHTLLTGAVPDCLEQSIWIANRWLLPPPESAVRLVFARERIDALPAGWTLPEVVATEGGETAAQGER